jgi:hypothetical protein
MLNRTIRPDDYMLSEWGVGIKYSRKTHIACSELGTVWGEGQGANLTLRPFQNADFLQ